MARRRRVRGFGSAVAGRVGGYPKHLPDGRFAKLTDGQGNVIGHGQKVGCTKIRPGARGAWISNERCTYNFKISGRWYACRGLGENMAASCRLMKKAPKGWPA
jgi:hypothetical protein